MSKIALISVYDKEGIAEFAKQLIRLDFIIYASGGTAKILSDANVPVKNITELIGGGPILGHRVVSLSREIYAGLLSRDLEQDMAELKELKIPRIDLVCVDIYPLKKEIDKIESISDSVREMTDIGGPSLIRAAAKGKRIVICRFKDRRRVIDWLSADCPNKNYFIDELAAIAEKTAAEYALISAGYHSKNKIQGFIGEKEKDYKYGENPHQKASLFICDPDDQLSLGYFKDIFNRPLSYNNDCDIDRALQTITHIAAVFDINYKIFPLIGLAVKHGNACGAAYGEDSMQVLWQMTGGDTRAIFGGTIMLNFHIDEKLARIIIYDLMPPKKRRFLELIIAPSFSEEAIKILNPKGKDNRTRLIKNLALSNLSAETLNKTNLIRFVRGGFIEQDNYKFILNLNDPRLEKNSELLAAEKDLLFAWAIGSTSNSNTITIVKDGYLIGNGVGQQDRVSCCKLAVQRASEFNHLTNGAVAYSDSFFPFTDGPAVLIEAGVKAVLTCSGSNQDENVRNLFKEHGVALYLIPYEIGRGFFGH